MRVVPQLCEFYLGICLTTEEKARKTLSQGSRRMTVGTMKTEYTEQSIQTIRISTPKYRSSVFASRHILVTLNQLTQSTLATIRFISISSSHPHFKVSHVTPSFQIFLLKYCTHTPTVWLQTLYSHSDSVTPNVLTLRQCDSKSIRRNTNIPWAKSSLCASLQCNGE